MNFLAAALVLFAAVGEEGPKIPPTTTLALQTSDGIVIKAEVYEFDRKNPRLTLIAIPPLGQSLRAFNFFLEEVKPLGIRLVFMDPRGMGTSTRLVAGGQIGWRTMERNQFPKMVDDVSLVASQFNKSPVYLMGFEYSATLAMLASKRVQADGVILFAPEEHVQGISATPSDVYENSAVFAAVGSENPRLFTLLKEWSPEFPAKRAAPHVILQAGVGAGFSSFRYSPDLRKTLWAWIRTVGLGQAPKGSKK